MDYKNFKVIELFGNGFVKITNYQRESPNDFKREINTIKKEAKSFEMFGDEGMVVWSK